MIPGFAQVADRLDPDARRAFEPSRANRIEAGVKAGEVAKHIAEAENLVRYGFPEDAQSRYEAATIAAADALLALTGGRLANAFRGRAHSVKKHFIVAALDAAGQSTPDLESLLAITRIRHLVEYSTSVLREHLTSRAMVESRQTADVVRRSLTALLSEAGIQPPALRTQEPHAPAPDD